MAEELVDARADRLSHEPHRAVSEGEVAHQAMQAAKASDKQRLTRRAPEPRTGGSSWRQRGRTMGQRGALYALGNWPNFSMQRFNMLRVPDEIGATPPFVLGSLYRFSARLLPNTLIVIVPEGH